MNDTFWYVVGILWFVVVALCIVGFMWAIWRLYKDD